MTFVDETSHAKLSGAQRAIVAGVLCAQVVTGVIFYPIAAVLVLTGILAPLSIVLARIGTFPLTWLLKRREVWLAGGAPTESGAAIPTTPHGIDSEPA